jgi:hypothetical protein
MEINKTRGTAISIAIFGVSSGFTKKKKKRLSHVFILWAV